jgi:hypothetical protein
MECNRVKKLLSEYIDQTIDKPTGMLIEEHLKGCEDCNYECIFLNAMVKELRSMGSLQAPKDLLNKIHERIEADPLEGRTGSFSFFPSWSRIPMELLAVGLTAVLIFIILNMIQPESQIMVAPTAKDTTGLVKGTERGLEKTRGNMTGPMTRTIKEMHPVQLTILLGTKPAPVPLPSENLRLIVSGKGSEMPLDTPEFGFNDVQDQETGMETGAYQISDIIDAISLYKGRVISKEYKDDTAEPEYIHLEIPAVNYYPFLEKIKDIGTLRSPAPDLPEGYQGQVQLQIRAISSDMDPNKTE